MSTPQDAEAGYSGSLPASHPAPGPAPESGGLEYGEGAEEQMEAEPRTDIALPAGDPASEATTHHLPSANASPSLGGSDADAALRLANEVRPLLGRQGFGDQRIDELAQSFVGQSIGATTEQFLLWAQAEGPLRQPWEPLI